MNYVNYINHTITTPETYHRRYDFDMPQEESLVKRIALAALPFISLYRPIGSAISVGMGSCRIISNLKSAIELQDQKEWKGVAFKIIQVTTGTFTLISTIFNYSLGLFITTASDISQGFYSAAKQTWEGEYQRAAEEALQVLASTTYLGFMATGALEVILISTLIQATICLYQARDEIGKGRYLEAGAKIAMGGIRLYQVDQYRKEIIKRDETFAIQKYRTLIEQALRGKQVRHLVHSPLNDLNGQIDEKQVILSALDESYEFGSHFHGFGKGLVKGANISFRKEIVDGKEVVQLDFKVNHVFRDQLEKTFAEMKAINPKEMSDILKYTGSHVKGVSFDKGEEPPFWSDELPSMDKIYLKGLGSISYGADPKVINQYNRITITMDADKTIYDLHEILAFSNLDTAIHLSGNGHLDRLKMGHLFRTFFPREATPLERSEEFFDLNLPDLKLKMEEKAPGMKEVFDTYYDKMTEIEILPGKIRYRINGLKEKIQELGAVSLTAAVTGGYASDKDLYSRVAYILSMGMTSSELRDTYGVNKGGLNGTHSYIVGGADSVYTQMITERDIQDQRDLNDFYHSKVRMLISLDALEPSTYQYYDDDFGNRQMNSQVEWWNDYSTGYEGRPNILEFTKTLQNKPTKPANVSPYWDEDYGYSGHEVMIKDRLLPAFFTGIMLDSIKTRDGLIDYLRTCNLIQKDRFDKETVLGIAIDKFFRVGSKATKELVS